MLIWRGHRAKVRALAFSPDGRRLASTAGNSKFVWLWDPTTGKRIQRLDDSWGHKFDMARSVAYFPDGQHIAASWERGGVTVWECATGRRAATLSCAGESCAPETLAIAADGSRIVGYGSRLLEWRNPTIRTAGDRRFDRTYALPVHCVPRLGFSPLGRYFCIGEWVMHLFDTATLEPRRVLHAQVGRASASAFAFTADESQLVVAFGHSAAVWRLDDRNARPVRCGSHSNLVRAVGFLPGGGTVLTASMDGTVRLWDSAAGTEVRSFDWGIGKVRAAAISPDGTLCAAGSDSGHLVVWDVDT